MRKKSILLIISAILVISMMGCSSNNSNSVEENSARNVAEVEEIILPGSWSEEYTRDEVKEKFDKALASVESTATGYSLDYEFKEDEIKEESGVSVNDTYVYLDIEDAERLESMYFGFKQFGSDLASGKIEMKMGFLVDEQIIKETQKFDIENTSIAAFSQAFTGDYERDYTDIDKQLYDIVMGNSDTNVIENNLDGLKETITIMDNYLLYKLESRTYNFK